MEDKSGVLGCFPLSPRKEFLSSSERESLSSRKYSWASEVKGTSIFTNPSAWTLLPANAMQPAAAALPLVPIATHLRLPTTSLAQPSSPPQTPWPPVLLRPVSLQPVPPASPANKPPLQYSQLREARQRDSKGQPIQKQDSGPRQRLCREDW